MSALPDSERKRLLVWSATRVMGWVTDGYTLNLCYHNVPSGGIANGQNIVMATKDWNPLVSLDQAAMVADRLRLRWCVGTSGYAAARLYTASVWDEDADTDRDDDSAPTALVVAVADAAGEKWRDD